MSNQLDKLGNHVRVTSIQMTDTVNFTRKLNQPPMMVFFSTRKHKSLRVEAKDFSTKLLSMPRFLQTMDHMDTTGQNYIPYFLLAQPLK